MFPRNAYNVYASVDDPMPTDSNSIAITSLNEPPNPLPITVEVDNHLKSPVSFMDCRQTGGTDWGQQMIVADSEQSEINSHISFSLCGLSVPHIRTTATGPSDHVKVLAPNGKVADEVEYFIPEPAEEYIHRGIKYEKTTGNPLYVNATTVTAERIIAPITPSSTIWLVLIAALVLLGGTLSFMAYKDRTRGRK